MRRRHENEPAKGRRANERKGCAKALTTATPSVADLQKRVDVLACELRAALERQTATAEVIEFINSDTKDLASAFAMILDKMHILCGVCHGSLQLYDGEKFRAVATHGMVKAFADRLREGFTPGPHHPSQQLLQGARFTQVPDCAESDDPTVRAAFELDGIRTVLLTPLRKDGRLIGQIAAARRDGNPFTENEITLLENFGAQAVIAVENARLLNEAQAKTRDLEASLQQQTAVGDVLKIISSSTFELQPVLDTLVETAARLCEADMAFILRREGEIYKAGAAVGYSEDYIEFLKSHPIPVDRGTVTGRAAMERRTVHILDVAADPEYTLRTATALAHQHTALGVPLLRENEPIGVIVIARQRVEPFTQAQIDLVTTFADQAVIAIENARLFNEVQGKTRDLEEALQQQTATSEVLQTISRSVFDLPTILNTLLHSATRLCRTETSALYLLHEGRLHLEASTANRPEWVAYKRAHPQPLTRDVPSSRAAVTGQIDHVPDILQDPELTSASELHRIGGYRATLNVPLVREGSVIGVLSLARDEPGPFAPRQIAVAKTFADQAVIAIANARLFNEVEAKSRELQASLDNLCATQDRLVQSEKLASLGQLTAGIAHEIKNPLNFVNNFAALSAELIDELNEVLAPPALDGPVREEVDELTGLLRGNLEKVVQHGKRADSIVRNMLLHSREGSGERRRVDVNALVEESLNLAYHGARAEKPGFTVTLARDLDPGAGGADLYPQEIARVLLNLISNGFHAVTKRKAETEAAGYEPTLLVATCDRGDKIEITIRDNGTGIPDAVRAKMFNPFFTTKPAGEGTGLGLSLSHDIVVKQHGGSIEVETEPGAFTAFRILLPRGGPTQ
ncbi:GAF sensor signal transduction histidine kinase [Methylobacterium sp. 4-46]|uniref:GAF domain-containing protein n=1 Tax=unclassified Methylobacterium TaxID=2615210 RepID=UPI000152D046|nr:GAF sensor signal transduction histidine kinase [Methylobacterium sp. 4-46]